MARAHEDRLSFFQARVAWDIEGRWGVSLLNSREQLLGELFPDLPPNYEVWDNSSSDVLQAFKDRDAKRAAIDLAARQGPDRPLRHGLRQDCVLRTSKHGPCPPASSSLAYP